MTQTQESQPELLAANKDAGRESIEEQMLTSQKDDIGAPLDSEVE